MLAEEDRSERKHLKLELKIASVEHRKGLKRRKEQGKNVNSLRSLSNL